MVDILAPSFQKAPIEVNTLNFPALVDSEISADFIKCMRTGETILVEYPYSSKLGRKLHLRYHLTPIRDERGAIMGCQVLVEDVSQVHQSAQQAKHLEQQLYHSQKMEAVGRLAGGVAHDFNNLLTGIIGFSEMILANLPAANPLREDIEEIQKAAVRASQLTGQLLAFSRKQVSDPKQVQVNEIIHQSIRLISRVIGEDVELEFQSGENLGHILVDPGQVDQILVNLAVNARDAMREGGKLIFKTERCYCDQYKCVVHNITPGDFIKITATDNGVGMDEEIKNRIFEPFFTTKQNDKSTGLGLATIYGIVKQNGGFIEVESEPGVGTTFEIYFPIITRQMDGRSHDQPCEIPRGDETILLAEDEDLVRRLAVRVLTGQGYNILEAISGKEALKLYLAYDGPIHLLLTDVVMPGMNGRELSEALLEHQPSLKTIYMSGYTEEVIANHGVKENSLDFIQKPFSIEALCQIVRKCLDE